MSARNKGQMKSGGQALTALGATASNDLLAIGGRHTGAEAMTALADEAARLIGTFHAESSE
jgi:hypothetical protein